MITQRSDETILVTVGDRTFQVAAACPHRRGRVAYAHVNGATMRITCPLHRSAFDLLTGRHLGGPASGPLQVREWDGSEPSC